VTEAEPIDQARLAVVKGHLAPLYARAGLRTRWYVRLRPYILPVDAIDRCLPQQGLILDVGCGYGVLTNMLAMRAPGRFLVGLDADAERIAIAQGTVGNRPNVAFLVADALHVPSRGYDGIVLTDFLHHLPIEAQNDFLRQASRKLNPGGVMAIREVGDSPRWKHAMSHLADRVLYPRDRIHYRRPAELTATLHALGFDVEVMPDHRRSPFCTYLYVCRKSRSAKAGVSASPASPR